MVAETARRAGRPGARARRSSRTRVERLVREAVRDPQEFARCRRRLERAIGRGCEPAQPWPASVAAAIRAALRFADADPVAARVIAAHAARRRYRSPAFAEMVDELAAKLAAGAPPARHPGRTARNVVQTIARQVLLRLELEPERRPSAIASDLIVFALTPYVGLAEARRWGEDEAASGGEAT